MTAQVVLEFPQTVLGWVGLFGVAVGAVAFVASSWRKGRNNALRVAHEELEVVSARAERLAKDLNDQRTRHEQQISSARADVAKLQGIVEQQRVEIEQLRQLVMMDTVPPPLIQAMQTVADQVASRIIAELKGDAA